MNPFIAALGGSFLAALVGVGAFLAARARRSGHDSGDYWSRLVRWSCVSLGPAVLLSGWLASIYPPAHASGYHLHLDVLQSSPLPQGAAFLVALATPFLVWTSLLAMGLVVRPAAAGAPDALAGGIGTSESRAWVLGLAVPLGALLALTATDLGRGQDGYPAAAWGTGVVLLLSLFGLALSRGRREETASDAPQLGETIVSPPPWPEAVRERGIVTTQVATWQPTPEVSERDSSSSAALRQALTARGGKRIAPEAYDAAEYLLASRRYDNMCCLLIGPDNCGQTEVVALLSEKIAHLHGETTLVVARDDPAVISKQLRRWTSRWMKVDPVGAAGEIPAGQVWVVDPATLSERLLPRLAQGKGLNRIGLVVWWELHEYSGVCAANVYAISRRFHRVLQVQGAGGCRTLGLARTAPSQDAQLVRFIRQLLPYDFHKVFQALNRRHCDITIHQVDDCRGFYAHVARDGTRDPGRDATLATALASVASHWDTKLDPHPRLTRDELDQLAAAARDRSVEAHLCASLEEAAVLVRPIDTPNILSLPESVSQGGRARETPARHHVAVAVSPNPYVAYLLSRVARAPSTGERRSFKRLTCPRGHQDLAARHLLLALGETGATGPQLLNFMQFEEKLVNDVLTQLLHDNRLEVEEIRFVNEKSDLQTASYYKASSTHQAFRSIDTVGEHLVEVHERAGGEKEGVRLRVDPDRALVLAYPHCVFTSGSRRYRVEAWTSWEEVQKTKRIRCDRHDSHQRTARRRATHVVAPTASRSRAVHGPTGKCAVRRAEADVIYEETVYGVHTFDFDPTAIRADGDNLAPSGTYTNYESPLAFHFATRALLLTFPDPLDKIGTKSMAQALAHTLPAHVGVEADAVEVVALERDGVAIVDLYPGGIGLIEALDDEALLDVLEHTRDWLGDCKCNDKLGCGSCLHSPFAAATDPDQSARRETALDALVRSVGQRE